MEEKRTVEKLLSADIEAAERTFSAALREKRSALEKKLEATPPASVRAVLSSYTQAWKQLKKAEHSVDALGWRITRDYHTDKISVALHSSPVLDKFDKDADAKKARFTTLKRSYTLKLFAGEGQASELVELLSKELAAILG